MSRRGYSSHHSQKASDVDVVGRALYWTPNKSPFPALGLGLLGPYLDSIFTAAWSIALNGTLLATVRSALLECLVTS